MLRAIARRNVTHERLRALLASYAAAVLPEADAEAVRAHLQTGCPDCLADFYRLPVGLVPRKLGRSWAASGVAAAAAGLAIALAATLGWLVRDIGARGAEQRAVAVALTDRLGGLEGRQGALAARVEALDARRAEVAARAAEVEAIRAQLERLVSEANQNRRASSPHPRRRADVERLLGGVDDTRLLRDLVRSPGLQLLPLASTTPSSPVYGHALYQPERSTVLLVVFGLPQPTAGAGYRARALAAAAPPVEVRFRPGKGGEIAVPLRFEGPQGDLERLDILREPGDESVLVWRRGSG